MKKRFMVEVDEEVLVDMKGNAEFIDSDVEYIERCVGLDTDSHGQPVEFAVNVTEIEFTSFDPENRTGVIKLLEVKE